MGLLSWIAECYEPASIFQPNDRKMVSTFSGNGFPPFLDMGYMDSQLFSLFQLLGKRVVWKPVITKSQFWTIIDSRPYFGGDKSSKLVIQKPNRHSIHILET